MSPFIGFERLNYLGSWVYLELVEDMDPIVVISSLDANLELYLSQTNLIHP
jgi:hypothetical protein